MPKPLCADPDCRLPFDRLTAKQTFCRRPECRKNRERKRCAKARKSLKETGARGTTRVYVKSVPFSVKMWPCRTCGKMSPNRLYCPDCRRIILKRNPIDPEECYGAAAW